MRCNEEKKTTSMSSYDTHRDDSQYISLPSECNILHSFGRKLHRYEAIANHLLPLSSLSNIGTP